MATLPGFGTLIDNVRNLPVTARREVGGPTLAVSGMPAISIPAGGFVRLSISYRGSRIARLIATGFDGADFAISGPADGWADVAIPVGATVSITFTAAAAVEFQAAILAGSSRLDGHDA